MMPALSQALMANLWRGELIPRALLDLRRPDPDEPKIIERAKAFLGLHEQKVLVPAQGLRQRRLHIPGVRKNNIIRPKRIHGRPKTVPNRRDIPLALGELDGLTGNQVVGPTLLSACLANPPARIPSIEVPHVIPITSQKINQPGGMHVAATGRRSIK